ncbi:archease [Candidatus Woesearchaeota archaeon]|nr:archease [Candidatus Woesearchaeota archaeon]MBW3017264.1 archease [Candidatus Woesearchaeota archaeon]
MKYEFLEHTADAKFRAYGRDLEEQFANAALAMYSIFVDTENVDADIEKEVEVEGSDEKSLLYNWLEELLYLIDAEEFMLNSVKEIKIEKFKLTATLVGSKFKEKYELLGGVKAATYNEMEITPEYVQVVVDV